MALAVAPKHVQSLPKGSMCQTYDIERSLNDALRMQANLKGEMARMKMRHQPAHLQARMLSEKLNLEDKVHDINKNDSFRDSCSMLISPLAQSAARAHER